MCSANITAKHIYIGQTPCVDKLHTFATLIKIPLGTENIGWSNVRFSDADAE